MPSTFAILHMYLYIFFAPISTAYSVGLSPFFEVTIREEFLNKSVIHLHKRNAQ